MLLRALFLIFIPIWIFADAHIFVYHRFGDDRYPSTSTSISQLKSDFDYLKQNGYKVIPLSILVDALENKKEIDDKWIVLTIDDGYKSFYENGLEIFKEYGYPFTLFVYTEASKRGYNDFMRVDMLQEASKHGELGLHTFSHPHMTKLSDSDIENDIKKGLNFFENTLGFKPKYFAYPYGEYDDRVENIAKSYGFASILNQNMGAVGEKSNIFCLDRNALTSGANIKNYLKYSYLDATWIEPRSFPKDGILKSISVKTNSNQKNAKLYISGMGWKDIELLDGDFVLKEPVTLMSDRTRLILKIKNKISNHLIVKKEIN